MGRPKKEDMGPVPTRERIIEAAIEQFANRGFDAVSVRDITRALGLNEASLYNHFKNKQDLYTEILQRLDDRLIRPGFSPIDPEVFNSIGDMNLADFLVTGANRFFKKADHSILLTWRILMMGQFRFETARDSLRTQLLDAPISFFRQIIEGFQKAGKIRSDVDSLSAARVVSSIFFEYSFRTNLDAAWQEESEIHHDALKQSLELVTQGLSIPG